MCHHCFLLYYSHIAFCEFDTQGTLECKMILFLFDLCENVVYIVLKIRKKEINFKRYGLLFHLTSLFERLLTKHLKAIEALSKSYKMEHLLQIQPGNDSKSLKVEECNTCLSDTINLYFFCYFLNFFFHYYEMGFLRLRCNKYASP